MGIDEMSALDEVSQMMGQIMARLGEMDKKHEATFRILDDIRHEQVRVSDFALMKAEFAQHLGSDANFHSSMQVTLANIDNRLKAVEDGVKDWKLTKASIIRHVLLGAVGGSSVTGALGLAFIKGMAGVV